MLPQNDYLIQRDVIDYHVDALMEDARQRRLLHDTGLARRTWLSCQVCRSLWHWASAGHNRPPARTTATLPRA